MEGPYVEIDPRIPRHRDTTKRPLDRDLPPSWWHAIERLANCRVRIAIEHDVSKGRVFLLVRTPEGPVGPLAEAAVYHCVVSRGMVVVNFGSRVVTCRRGRIYHHFFRIEGPDGRVPTRRRIRAVFRFDPVVGRSRRGPPDRTIVPETFEPPVAQQEDLKAMISAVNEESLRRSRQVVRDVRVLMDQLEALRSGLAAAVAPRC